MTPLIAKMRAWVEKNPDHSCKPDMIKLADRYAELQSDQSTSLMDLHGGYARAARYYETVVKQGAT